MNENEFIVQLMAELDPNSITNIKKDIKALQDQLNGKKLKLKIDFDTDAGRQNIQNLARQVQSVLLNASNGRLSIDTSQIIDSMRHVNREIANTASKANTIQLNIDTGAYEAKIAALTARAKQWTDGNGNARITTDGLVQSFRKLKEASDAYTGNKTIENQKSLIATGRELDTQLKTVTNSVRKMNAEVMKDAAVDTLLQKYQQFYYNNGAAHKQWGAQLKRNMSELSSGMEVPIQRGVELRRELVQIQNAAEQAGKTGKTWFQKLGDSMKVFSSYVSPVYLMTKGISEVRKGLGGITDLDTALVDLKKTAAMTGNQLDQFYYSSNDVAKQMGVTTEEIIKQASAWSRLGYSTDEQAEKMAKLSSQFAAISPGMGTDEAASGLVSIMKAYDIGVDDVLTEIEDKVNTAGNNFAISNENIVTMLQKSVSAMAEGRNSLEETIALETAAYEIVQDESVGTGFKTVALRLRGLNEETEKLDDSLKTIKGDLYDLTGVSIMEDEDTYKSTYKILQEVSRVWDSLTDTSRAAALELMFGKNRANIGAAVLKNFQAAEDAMAKMADSAGSADRELEVAMDSVEAKMNALSQTWTGVFQNLFHREDMKSVLDVFTKFAEAIDSVTDKLGLFGTAGLGAGLFAGINNFGIFKTVQDSIDSTKNKLLLFNKDWNTYKANWQSASGFKNKVGSLFTKQTVSFEDVSAIKAYNAQIDACVTTQTAFNRTMLQASPAAQDLVASYNGAKVSVTALTAAQKSSTIAAKAGSIAFKALAIAGNMILFAAIAKTISFVSEKLHEFANAAEIAKEKAHAFGESAKASMENIAGNKSTLSELNEEYQKLSKGVTDLGTNTSLTSDEYDRYKEIVSQISDIMPDLNTLFNSQGEAIGFAQGKLSDLNNEYERQIQLESQKFLVNGDSEGNTLQDALDSFRNLDKHGIFESFTKGIKNFLGFYDEDDVPTGALLSVFEELKDKSKEDLLQYLNTVDTDTNGAYLQTENNRAKAIAQKMLESTGIQIKDMTDEDFNNLKLNIISYIQSLKNEYDVEMSNIKAGMIKSAYSKEEFWTLDDKQKDNVTTLLSSITSDTFKDIFKGNENIPQSDLEAYIGRLINGIKTNQNGFADAWNGLFSLDTSKLTTDEYITKIKDYKDKICDALEISGDDQRREWMITLGFDVDTDQAKLEGLQRKIEEITGSNSSPDTAEWVKSLTVDEVNFANSDAFINALEMRKQELGSLTLTAKDYEAALNDVQNAQNNTPKIKSLSKALSGLDEDAVSDYQSKISSLQSCLEKFKSGSCSSTDMLELADEFGIVGDSAEEVSKKIQKLMDKEMDSIVTQIDEILNTQNLDGKTRKALELLKQTLIDVNKETKNLSGFTLTNNALADVQKLSEGLDQLDKIYSDILDKEDFDWSSILNNADFTKTFGAYTKEYQNFINTVSSSPDDINACQEAFNKLVSAYVYGSGVLDEVTEATKGAVTMMLEQMGVSNAAAIVEQALINNERVLEAQKYATAHGCRDLTSATYEEVNALLTECEASADVQKYLAKLALEKWEVEKTKITTKEDCENLLRLAEQAGATEEQFKRLKNAIDNVNSLDIKSPTTAKIHDKLMEKMAEKYPEYKKTSTYKEWKKAKKQQKEIHGVVDEINDNNSISIDAPEINYTGGSTTRDTMENIRKEQEQAQKEAEDARKKALEEAERKKKEEEDSKEQFDWMAIALDKLSSAASKARDKIDDLLTFGAKKRQTQKAIEKTTTAIEAQYKAMKKYKAYALEFSADAAKETTELVTETVSNAASNAASSIASSVTSEVAGAAAGVVNDAMQYVGKLPYVWGGTSLVSGADCSGFVQQLYKKYGVNLGRTTWDQIKQGTPVDRQNLQPGDLVFFGTPGNPTHVGFYAGNGQFIHEPRKYATAEVSYLSSRSNYIGARRFSGIPASALSSDVSSPVYDTSSSEVTYIKTVPGIPKETLAKYQKKVREGGFDVETIKNEKLKNAIKSYQEWWEKVQACKDEIDSLNSTLRELYKTMAEIPLEKRDKKAESIDSRIELLESRRENIDGITVSKKKFRQTNKQIKKSGRRL